MRSRSRPPACSFSSLKPTERTGFSSRGGQPTRASGLGTASDAIRDRQVRPGPQPSDLGGRRPLECGSRQEGHGLRWLGWFHNYEDCASRGTHPSGGRLHRYFPVLICPGTTWTSDCSVVVALVSAEPQVIRLDRLGFKRPGPPPQPRCRVVVRMGVELGTVHIHRPSTRGPGVVFIQARRGEPSATADAGQCSSFRGSYRTDPAAADVSRSSAGRGRAGRLATRSMRRSRSATRAEGHPLSRV